ncbi:hypothetical protein GF357_03135 [Candidatus Dojkabacteria bacterium]|nr:hypothetical protein [Candidatus Dojkabacteria bacterium]
MSNKQSNPLKEYDYSELKSEFFGSLISPKSFSDELRDLLYFAGASAILLQRHLPEESLVPDKLEEALFSIRELCPILDRMEESRKAGS